MLASRKRCMKRRLLRLLERAIERGIEGTLPEAMRWILGSTAAFLDKPVRDVPRPIRSGEWFRKAIAKVLLRRHRAKIRQTMLALQQYDVMIPGGAEALYHARATIEEAAEQGTLEPLAIVDVDMVNFFGSVEWNQMLEAYAELSPEAFAW